MRKKDDRMPWRFEGVNGVKNWIIDVHAHFLPPVWYQALKASGMADQSKQPLPQWDVQSQLEFMDAMHIEVSMLSISSPHVHFGDDAGARKLARELNEAGAKLVNDYPDRFGHFAVMPLPDVEGALKEIEYALDVLKADGIKLSTNSRGVYLGEDPLEPIFAELNRRRAVVVIHPVLPSAVPNDVLTKFPIAMMEFFFDTARAVANLVLNGTLQRNPGIKLIIPHAGGVLPILVARIENNAGRFPQPGQSSDIPGDFRNFYYDLAGPSIRQQLPPLLQITDVSHLLYGSDAPYPPAEQLAELLQQLKTDLLPPEQYRAIYRDNARALFPGRFI
jgi:predicted TIM-barrel fold metal-dependent hydrolase